MFSESNSIVAAMPRKSARWEKLRKLDHLESRLIKALNIRYLVKV